MLAFISWGVNSEFELRRKAVANSESQEKFRVYTGKIQGLSEIKIESQRKAVTNNRL